MKNSLLFLLFFSVTLKLSAQGEATYLTAPFSPDTYTLNTSLPVGYQTGSPGVSPSGDATYQIPIYMPNGTGGMTPQLSIYYNSQAGNSILGMGFDLSGISVISRANMPYYATSSIISTSVWENQLAIDGNILVLQSGTQGVDGSVYKTESETFNTIYLYGNIGTGSEYFKVQTKDQRILYYGNTANSKIQPLGSVSSLGYFLTKVTDPNGNYIVYNYGRSTITGESYLQNIQYTGNSNTGLAPYNQIDFYYNTRTDKNKTSFKGMTVESTLLLKKIDVKVSSTVIRSYQFFYYLDLYTHLNIVKEFNGQGVELSSNMIKWGVASPIVTMESQPFLKSLYNKIQLVGDFNGDGKYELFILNDTIPPYRPTDRWVLYSKQGNQYVQLDSELVGANFYEAIVFDYDHDGTDDLLFHYVQNNTNVFKLYKLVGNDLQYISTPFTEPANQYLNVLPGDMDNNGKTDLMLLTQANYLYKVIGAAIEPGDWNYDNSPSDIVLSTDINGNGYTELTHWDNSINPAKLSVWESTPGTSCLIPIIKDFKTTRIGYPQQEIYPCDFNGDGLTDLLLVGIDLIGTEQSVSTRMLFSTGTGFYEKPGPSFQKSILLTIPYSKVEVTRDYDWDMTINVFDINSDGKSDIIASEWCKKITSLKGIAEEEYEVTNSKIFLSDGVSLIWQNVSIPVRLNVSNGYDYNYDGNPDFAATTCDSSSVYEVSFFKNDQRHVVSEITNSANIKAKFIYESLVNTDHYYREQESITFPVQNAFFQKKIVTRFDIIDRNHNKTLSSTSFRYSNLKVHRQGKGLLGFSTVSARNLLSADSVIMKYKYDSSLFIPYRWKTESFINNQKVSETINSPTYSTTDNGKRYINTADEFQEISNIHHTTKKVSTVINQLGDITNRVTLLNDPSGNTLKTITENFVCNGYGYPTSIEIIQAYNDSTITKQQQIVYDTRGHIISHTSLFGNSPSITAFYKYDSFGNKLRDSITCGGITRTASVRYEPLKARFVTSSTNTLGQTESYGYDGLTGLLKNETDHNNLATSYNHDILGRVINITYSDGSSRSISRGWSNNILGIGEMYYVQSSATGSPAAITYYDVTGRELKSKAESFDGRNLVTDNEYDIHGRLVKTYHPYLEGDERTQYSTYAYDSFGRLSTETLSPNNSVTFYRYDQLKTTVERAGRLYETEYDAAGMKIRITEPGGEISYNYDAEGKISSILSPSGLTSIEYDDYGRQKKLIDIDAGETDYNYNGFGELITQTDAKGNILTNVYDNAGRITTETWNTGLTKSYTYYPGSGLLHTANTSDGTEISYTYDSYLRPQSVTQKADAQNTFTKVFAYNTIGQLSSIVTNSLITETYTYNTRGYQDQVIVNGNLIWKGYSQNKYGIIDNFKLRNNNETTVLSFDQYGFISGIQTTAGPTLQNWSYSFDPLTGNMLNRRGLRTDGSIVTESFNYDTQDRLTTSTLGQNVVGIVYNTAGTGSITSKTDVGIYNYNNKIHTPDFISNPTSVLASLPKQEASFTPFNKINSLKHTIDSATVKELSWVYAPNNERTKQILKLNGQVANTKYYAFGNYEKEVISGISRELYYINSPSGTVAVVEVRPDSTNFYYIHTDLLGSFDVITKSNGNIKERNSFDPWGRRRNPADWSYNNVNFALFTGRGFTGHEHLNDFGLINMNGRVYDPLLAMFISPDNYIQAPGVVQNFNRYGYCLNNPLKYTDPTGNFVAPWYSWTKDASGNARPPKIGGYRGNDPSSGNNAITVGLYGYSAGPSSDFLDDWYRLSAGQRDSYGNSYSAYATRQEEKISESGYYWKPDVVTSTGEYKYFVENGVLKQIYVETPCVIVCAEKVMVPSSGGDGYRYGSPEADILWLISASGYALSKFKESQYIAEISSRLKQLIPFSVNINTGKVQWANPKLLKVGSWAGITGTGGDILHSLGILYNVYGKGEGWTTTNSLDGTFSAIGFYPAWGDAAALWYTGMKGLVQTEGFQNTTEVWRDYGISPSFRHCFAKGTKVMMGNRTLKNIEDIDVGDAVLTYNFSTRKFEINPVLEKICAVDIKLIKVIFSNNKEVISTEDHPYYVKGKGWCSFNPDLTFQKYGFKTEKMEISDFCFTPSKRMLRKVKLVQILQINKMFTTYNLSKIENSNCYFVNGILVNNESDVK